jgi:hypothetical protein
MGHMAHPNHDPHLMIFLEHSHVKSVFMTSPYSQVGHDFNELEFVQCQILVQVILGLIKMH